MKVETDVSSHGNIWDMVMAVTITVSLKGGSIKMHHCYMYSDN